MITQEGENKPYKWIVISFKGDFRGLGTLVHKFPNILEGTTIIIPVFDSGKLEIGPVQEKKGWKENEGVVIIENVIDAKEVPVAQNSEYYLFTEEYRRIPQKTFVNDIFFIPKDDNNEFWPYIKKINPETIIIEKDYTFVASRNELLIKALKQRFSD